MDISNLTTQIPIELFTEEQKRIAILTWVAENIKPRLKDYNLKGFPTGYSRRLWGEGRGVNGSRGFMENRIKSNIKLNIGENNSEKELLIIKEELAENIIENSLIIVEDLLSAARKAKTSSVRSKYLKAMNSKEFLLSTAELSIMLYAKTMITAKIDIQHSYLSSQLDALKVNKSKINTIWRSYAHGDLTFEEANEKYRSLLVAHEKSIVTTTYEIGRIAEEKLLYKLLGQDTLELYVYQLTDSIVQNITGKVRLFSI